MQFTQPELQAISALINRANITGQEAIAVAQLLIKISSLIQPVKQEPAPKPTNLPGEVNKKVAPK